ncbi:MAG: outer membrane beta-barrel protein [Desulfatibacillaceae bacterium]|nr:outer membrane beta-barrel protein [Desulfatibacillaceae bacterium]
MTRRFIAFFALAFFCLAPQGFADEKYGTAYGPETVEKPFFIGIGASFALDNTEVEELTQEIRPLGQKVDFDNSWGINLRAGYKFTGIFAGEVAFDWINGFPWEGSYIFKGGRNVGEITAEVMTLTAAGRLAPPIGDWWRFRPYLFVGGGLMQAVIKADYTRFGQKFGFSNHQTQICLKGGGGADFFLTKSISLGLEASYTQGLQNLEEIGYFLFTGNTAYHF